MKRMFLTFLVFLYLGSSSGFAMHFHYCMDELVGTSLIQTEVGECDNCGMEMSSTDDNGCCKEEYKQLKVDTNENIDAFALQMMQILVVSLPAPVFEIPSFLQLATTVADYPLVNSPAEKTIIPVYLRNCVFRI